LNDRVIDAREGRRLLQQHPLHAQLTPHAQEIFEVRLPLGDVANAADLATCSDFGFSSKGFPMAALN
jgi:hypothetical protein